MDETNKLTKRIIGCAIEVHRELGPGLLESAYKAALAIELDCAGLSFQRQLKYPVFYKGKEVGEYRLDLVVENAVVVEVKSVDKFDPIFQAQLLTYLRVTDKRAGLLINFNSRLLRDGIKRIIR